MNEFFLDRIQFRLDPNHFKNQWRVEEESEDAIELERLINEAQAIANPKAFYKVAYIDEKGDDFVVISGIKFISRILRVNLDQANRAFPYIATCGKEIDEWSNQFEITMAHYWVDSIKETILGAAVQLLYAEKYQ